MKAFLDTQGNLQIILTGETPDDLILFHSITELVQVYLPKLQPVIPSEIRARTNAPIFKYQELLWYIPEYLEVDPLEHLRDNGWLKLQAV